jgi:hypothetical protein
MRRPTVAALLLIGLLVAGRVATRVWGANPEVAGAHGPVSSFIMTVEGDSSLAPVGATTVVGEAAFRRRSTRSGAEFSLELGTISRDAAVLFAAAGLGPQGTGQYRVDDQAGSGAMHALIVTGSPGRTRAVYRAHSGTVTLRRDGNGTLEGSFELQSEIKVSGSFLAVER